MSPNSDATATLNVALALLGDVTTALSNLLNDPEMRLTTTQATKFHDLTNATRTATAALATDDTSDDAFAELDAIVTATRRTQTAPTKECDASA
ncbi:hypothetical protein [Actinokineospora spheciospongiae]|uniref:hypothetical protein n=1 Tax=Actinokineospora spheciospongiae TaxID=909613 RepID=UPI000D71108A|nr:hypothetical protein [Actinokineospora spheciospongiae]PWW65606.1 hypothetical protein DFQ13_102361 [Actinokineospora spheciospongiae]